MKNVIIAALVFIQVNAFAQCIEGNEIIVNDSITVTSIVEKLKISAPVNLVEVSQGSTQSIIVSGDSNILDSLDIYSLGDTLIVNFPSDTCYNNYTLNINISTPNITGLDFEASGNIKINDFDNSFSLNIVNDGSGNIDVAEYASATFFDVIINGSGVISMLSDFPSLESYSVEINGSGEYQGCQLSVDSCFATINGSGFVSVSANEYLEVLINGSGTVEYYGAPTDVLTSIFGTGDSLEGDDTDCNMITSTNEHAEYIPSELVKVFPNPTSGIINVAGKSNERHGVLLNLLGEPLIRFDFSNETQLDLSHLPSGVYLFKVGNYSVPILKK